jgi:hypothetical protein
MEKYKILKYLFAFFYIISYNKLNGSHFNGGFITAYPKSSNSTHVTFVFYTRFSYTRTSAATSIYCDDTTIQSQNLIGPSSNFIRCQIGCNIIGESIGNTQIECTAFSTLNDWTLGENRFEYTLPIVSNYEASYSSTAWRLLTTYTTGIAAGGWEIRVKIDARTREDSKKVNSSPFAFVPPVVVLKIGTIFTLKMPKYDSDGDVTKCRWSNYTNGECACIVFKFEHKN